MRTDNRANNLPPTFAALQEMWREREEGYQKERERHLELLREAYVVLISPSYMGSRQPAAQAVAARIAHVLDTPQKDTRPPLSQRGDA